MIQQQLTLNSSVEGNRARASMCAACVSNPNLFGFGDTTTAIGGVEGISVFVDMGNDRSVRTSVHSALCLVPTASGCTLAAVLEFVSTGTGSRR